MEQRPVAVIMAGAWSGWGHRQHNDSRGWLLCIAYAGIGIIRPTTLRPWPLQAAVDTSTIDIPQPPSGLCKGHVVQLGQPPSGPKALSQVARMAHQKTVALGQGLGGRCDA